MKFDPETQKILDAFDAHAKKRFVEMLGQRERNPQLQAAAEVSFCLGYKTGVVDLSATRRDVVAFAHMAAVFVAASAWRDSPKVDAGSLAGTVNEQEARLIAAVDAARAARKEGSS